MAKNKEELNHNGTESECQSALEWNTFTDNFKGEREKELLDVRSTEIIGVNGIYRKRMKKCSKLLKKHNIGKALSIW